VPAGGETDRALRTLAEQTEGTIARLLSARAELQAQPVDGLSQEDSLTLENFAEVVGRGVANASGQDQRRIYQILRLTVRLRHDQAGGVKLGRRNRFAVDLKALIDIPHREHSIDKLCLSLHSGREYQDDREHGGGRCLNRAGLVAWAIREGIESDEPEWRQIVRRPS
jgi:hypothetical protein